MIPPAVFIPLAEAIGVMVADWTWADATAWSSENWHDAFSHLSLAVNLSLQLQQPDLLQRVRGNHR